VFILTAWIRVIFVNPMVRIASLIFSLISNASNPANRALNVSYRTQIEHQEQQQ
jgi:hypothetical protein